MLFKHHPNSTKFRRVWLLSARLIHVVNFAHVRHVFFSGPQRNSGGISPFISVVFEKSSKKPLDNRFQYWSAKRTAVVDNVRSVVLSRADMHWLSQRDCIEYEKLWKIYWWGRQQDEALIRSIERFPALRDLPSHIAGLQLSSGQGFKEANKAKSADWLKDYSELRSREFRSYGPMSTNDLAPVPPRVEHRGARELYSGRRLLVSRGIKKDGRIRARFETSRYCFRNSIHGIRFEGLETWQEAVVTAIFWSSISRYYHFLTSGSWGLWHDEIHLTHVQSMPIRFPTDANLRRRIVRVVQELQNLDVHSDGLPLIKAGADRLLPELEQELNAAVFDLYELNMAQRDIIRELCSTGLDLFYNNQHSCALAETARPDRHFGTLTDVSDAERGLSAYLRVFMESWKREVDDEGELFWKVLSPPSRAPLLAVSFSMSGNERIQASPNEHEEWYDVLEQLQQSSRLMTGASRVFLDTFFRYVGNEELLFVKRNEQRFWSRSAAREDVASTITHLMNRDDVEASSRQ